MTTKKILRESALVAVWFALAATVYFMIDGTAAAKSTLIVLAFVAWCGGVVTKEIAERAIEKTREEN